MSSTFLKKMYFVEIVQILIVVMLNFVDFDVIKMKLYF